MADSDEESDAFEVESSDADSDFGGEDAAPAKKKSASKPKKTPAAAKAPAAKDDDEYLDLTQDEPFSPAVLTYEPEEKEEKPKKKPATKKAPATLKRELPLTFAPSAGREGKSTLLLELDERAGGFGVDTGAIGRASFPRVDGRRKFRLDLRGQEYDATIKPCPTMLVVNAAGDEAKVEAVLSEYVTLRHTHDATRDRGYAGGDFDDGYRQYAGDINVNARGRRKDDYSDSDEDAGKKKKAKAKPAAKKARKPAARKPAAKKAKT